MQARYHRKAQQQINDMLFIKRESIKLSWLADRYTEYLNSNVDEEDKYNVNGRWHFEVLEDVSEHVSGLKEIVMGLFNLSADILLMIILLDWVYGMMNVFIDLVLRR